MELNLKLRKGKGGKGEGGIFSYNFFGTSNREGRLLNMFSMSFLMSSF